MDFPNVSCEKCKEALEIDGVEPPCFNDIYSCHSREGGNPEIPGVNSCWIPALDERGKKILELRQKLVNLQGLVDSETILKMYDATIEDIEMLAFVEEEIKKMQTDNADSHSREGGNPESK